MEITEKQEFDEVLLRLTQLGFAAVKAEAQAYITPEAIKSSKDELTAADIAIEFCARGGLEPSCFRTSQAPRQQSSTRHVQSEVPR